MIKTTIATLAAGQLFKRIGPKRKQQLINLAKSGVNKINSTTTNFLDGLTEAHDDRINAMLESGELYYKSGELFYKDTHQPFNKVK